MSKRKPQVEDAIIKEFMIEAFKWSVLILFVLSLCLVGYLIAENEQMQNEKQNFQPQFDSLAKVKLKEDSTINAMPEYIPGGWHVDSNGIANPNFTQND